MNENRRKQIRKLEDFIENDIRRVAYEFHALIERARDEAQQIADDEQESLDNLPESLADSDRAADMQEAVDNMLEVVDKLDEVFDGMETFINDDIREMIGKTDEAKGSE